jgi:ribonuclease HII
MNASGLILPLSLEAGVDEAGRGCLAGPVVAAAVILPEGYDLPLLNDSKQVKEAQREVLREHIMRDALAFGIGLGSVEEIDRVNILQATYLAMHRAIEALHMVPSKLLIDGNRFKPYPQVAHQTVIGGDAKHVSIAAASILAKTERDRIMLALHKNYPNYQWNRNKGYGTQVHRNAMKEFGQTVHHRKSFRLKSEQLGLFA